MPLFLFQTNSSVTGFLNKVICYDTGRLLIIKAEYPYRYVTYWCPSFPLGFTARIKKYISLLLIASIPKTLFTYPFLIMLLHNINLQVLFSSQQDTT